MVGARDLAARAREILWLWGAHRHPSPLRIGSTGLLTRCRRHRRSRPRAALLQVVEMPSLMSRKDTPRVGLPDGFAGRAGTANNEGYWTVGAACDTAVRRGAQA